MTDRDFLRALPAHGAAGRRLREGWISGLTELELLRCLLVGEAEGEGTSGQVAIVWVIRNRVEHPGWWGSTPTQVMLWPHQFSCFWSDYRVRRAAMRRWVFMEQSSWGQDVLDWYIEILCHPDRYARVDPTGGATHYWNPAVCSPAWAGGLAHTVRIGHHVFGREG